MHLHSRQQYDGAVRALRAFGAVSEADWPHYAVPYRRAALELRCSAAEGARLIGEIAAACGPTVTIYFGSYSGSSSEWTLDVVITCSLEERGHCRPRPSARRTA